MAAAGCPRPGPLRGPGELQSSRELRGEFGWESRGVPARPMDQVFLACSLILRAWFPYLGFGTAGARYRGRCRGTAQSAGGVGRAAFEEGLSHVARFLAVEPTVVGV